MIVKMERRLWTVDEFHHMAKAGILHEEDRLELIEGDIVTMSPIGVRHMACGNKLTDTFSASFTGKAIISVQNPLAVSKESEPVPDIVLFKYRDDFYADEMPEISDVLLVVEVADTTIAYDRNVKRPLYARAGIPDYWLVNLVDNVIEIHREPEDDTYTKITTAYRSDSVTAVAFPDTPFAVTDLIPGLV